MIQIHPRHAVAAAYRRALNLGGTPAEAIASTAQALGLAPEAVQEVINQPEPEECHA